MSNMSYNTIPYYIISYHGIVLLRAATRSLTCITSEMDMDSIYELKMTTKIDVDWNHVQYTTHSVRAATVPSPRAGL
jgi:hypothetical protein